MAISHAYINANGRLYTSLTWLNFKQSCRENGRGYVKDLQVGGAGIMCSIVLC